VESGRGQVEVEGFGKSDESSNGEKGGGVGLWAGSLSKDWNCDWGVWGSGSGREGTVRHVDHGRSGLSDRGEGQGTGDQPDFGRAPRDGNLRGERAKAHGVLKGSYWAKKEGVCDAIGVEEDYFVTAGSG